jgi:hypothetical protein
MDYNARHFRLTRLAHMRGIKATRNTCGGYLVSSHSNPGRNYLVTPDGKCECAALLSCTHGELVRKIEANGNMNLREWQAYQDAWRADFYRLKLRIQKGRVRGSDRDFMRWCMKQRPESAYVPKGDSFGERLFA